MTQRTESWKPVVGWEGLYEVSDMGRVRSLPRSGGNGRMYGGGVLTPYVDRDGYLTVVLKYHGRRTSCKVHRLVLQAFAGPGGPQTRHGSGGKADNRWPENIQWGTQLENEADKLRDGTRLRGSDLSWAKLSERDIPVIRERVRNGERQCDLTAEYGVSKATISRVISGVCWGHVS